jgi:segregation and condensation protein A
MDLLIHLIKKNKVDIHDIPVAVITDQYLAYLSWMKSMNIAVVGEFVVMAATLIHIKSKMLLPKMTDQSDEDDQDPRQAIVGPLQAYIQIKSAADRLSQRALLGEDIFTRAVRHEFPDSPAEGDLVQVDLFELIDAFQTLLKNISSEQKLVFSGEKTSIKDRISQIIDLLIQKKSMAFEELFVEGANKLFFIITFLAVLEMVKLCLIQIRQHVQTGTIRLFYL